MTTTSSKLPEVKPAPPPAAPNTASQIGRRVPQHGAEGRVTGKAVFTQDVQLPGMLFAAVLRSPHAHARIVGIDVSYALRANGVRAVITASDFPGIKYVHFGPQYSDRYPLASGVVRFVGEEVAAVAADTLEQARDAVRLIRVDYEVLPAVLDPQSAQERGAPLLHDDALNPGGKNVAHIRDLKFGDVETAFRSAARVFENEYEHGVVVPCCMETNGTVASWGASSGHLTLWTATQGPHFIRKEVAHVLDLPVEHVHVRGVDVGGGFGGKSKVCEQEALASLLSVKTGRPVKLTLDRREEFLSGKTDHAKRMKLRTAVDAKGNILARAMAVEFNNGAYTALAPTYMAASRARTTSLYRVGAAQFQSKIVYTNRVPGGQYRGMGAPQTIWAIESQIEEIAQALGLDPLEYRIQIANQSGDVTPLGWKITGCGLADCLREAGRRIGWAEKRANRKPWRGVGIAAMIHPSAGTIYEEGNYSNTKIELLGEGVFRVYTQTADTGTWQNTVLAQLAAQALGVDHALVTVRHMDTDAAPSDLGSAASRVTFVTGNSTIRAAAELRAEILRRVARLWHCADTDLLLSDAAVTSAAGDRRISLRELVEREGSIAAQGYYRIPTERPHPETGFGNYAAAYTFGAQAAEVEVDPATGKVTILKMVAVHDVGRPINPTALEGQIQGGILQGIGMALQEELVYEDNQPVNANFLNYKVPRIGDSVPIEVAFVHTDEFEGPFGAKAGGEPSINPTIAAIANAVADATGMRFAQLPITPHRLLARIVEQQGCKLPLHPEKRPYNLHVGVVRAMYPPIVFPALRHVGTKFAKMPKPGAKPDIVRAGNLQDLVGLLAGGDAKVLAGGTDLMVGIQQGIYSPSRLVEIGAVRELRELAVADGVLRIGAGMRLSEVAADPLVRRHLPMLAGGIGRIATPQIRNMATVAGDLCQEKRCWFFRSAFPCFKNGGTTCPCFAVMGDSRHHSIMGAARCAAPCPADLAPIFTALDAKVIAASSQGLRSIPMEELYLWSGLTQLRADEVMLRIDIPLVPQSQAVFEKFAMRRGDFAEASVAVRVVRAAGGGLSDVRISLGAVSPLPMRAVETEKHVLAHGTSAQVIRAAAARCVWGSLPLRDNAHKAHLVVGLAERALAAALN